MRGAYVEQELDWLAAALLRLPQEKRKIHFRGYGEWARVAVKIDDGGLEGPPAPDTV